MQKKFETSDLREGFLTSNDEIRSPVLQNYPGRCLDPQPVSRFSQQPEDREAAVSRLYHWEQRGQDAEQVEGFGGDFAAFDVLDRQADSLFRWLSAQYIMSAAWMNW